MIRYQGLVWRHVPTGAHPLHIGYILKARGRWNRSGVYGCLYTSTSREGALAEYHRYLARAAPGVRTRPRDLVSIRVNLLEPVLDLTDESVLAEFRITRETLTGDTVAARMLCLRLADYARGAGAVGILAPSATSPATTNLMIYPDGPPEGIDLDEGPDREPIPGESRPALE